MALGAAALIAGLWSGLSRIGVVLPGGPPQFANMHGALLICGFFGTLISLERAVALGQNWAYLAPAFSAAGAIALLMQSTPAAGALFLAASAILALTSIFVANRQPLLITVVMTIAAASWGMGTAAWLAGHATTYVTGWWISFLVLMIAAERLELSRVLSPSPAAQALFVAAIALVFTGSVRDELSGASAPLLLGLGLLACSAWLFIHDVARRTVMRDGQIRFCSAAMLAGYFWLGVCGVLLLMLPPQTTVFGYDAAVHTITIGFVLSMVFGHALIILPAVMRLPLVYSPALYLPLALLHGSLAVRVVSDILEWPGPRALSGVLTIIALALFAVTLAFASSRKRKAAR